VKVTTAAADGLASARSFQRKPWPPLHEFSGAGDRYLRM